MQFPQVFNLSSNLKRVQCLLDLKNTINKLKLSLTLHGLFLIPPCKMTALPYHKRLSVPLPYFTFFIALNYLELITPFVFFHIICLLPPLKSKFYDSMDFYSAHCYMIHMLILVLDIQFENGKLKISSLRTQFFKSKYKF